MKSTRRLVLLALLVSQALVLSIIESWIPNPVPFPGINLGLANIITLTVIIFFGLRDAASVVLVRCILSAIFTGRGLQYFIFSITGGILSTIVMSVLFKMKPKLFSIAGISIAGAITHNIGQIIVASLIMKDFSVVIVYLPILLVSGAITGFFVGTACGFLSKALKKTNIIS